MTTQTVTLRLVAENGQLVGTLNASKKEIEALGAAGEASGKQAAGGMNAVTTSSQAATKAVGATNTAQTSLTQATQAATGAAKSQAAAAQASATAVKAQAASAVAATNALNQYGITAGQQKQALRQLPAQITDIVTSLVSGQPAYLVAIQQGGQLRDSFGGIGGAAKALVGALNPVTIVLIAAAAAIGGVAFQALQGYKELREFDRAILSSGNAAGATAGELADLADSIGKATGRFGDARDAVRELAASGQITGETLARAGRAAVALAALTGSSVAEATQKIVDLAKTPSEALLKLNQQYNVLTPATYRQVQALEEQGRLTDAARIAIDAFGEAQEKRLAEAESRAGSLERAYEGVRRAIVGLFEGLRDVGRTDNEFLLREAQERLREAELSAARFAKDTGSRPESASANPSVVQAREEVRRLEELIRGTKEKAEAEAKAAADNAKELAADQARKQAQASLDRLRISNLNKQQSLEREIAEIRELSAKAGAKQADIERDVAQARARFAEQQRPSEASREAKRTAELADDARKGLADRLQGLRDENALLAQGYTLDRAREELRVRAEAAKGGLDADALAAYIAELRTETSVQEALLGQQKAANDAAEEAVRIRERNLQLIRETHAALDAELASLFDGATAAAKYEAQRARLIEQGTTPEEAQDQVNKTRVRDTLQNNRGLVGLEQLDFDQVLDLSTAFDALDDLESRLESIGGTGADAMKQIVRATKAFEVASESSGKKAYGAYVQGAAASLTAIQTLTREGSSSYEKLGVAIQALHAVTAVQAALNAFATAPFPANFAALAAALAAIASLGVSIGGSAGGVSGAPAATASKNLGNGTGTVLGDPGAKSASIAHSIEQLEKYAEIDLGYSAQQLQALRSIAAALAGVSSQLFRANIATGGATPFNAAGTERATGLARFGAATSAASLVSKIPVFGQLSAGLMTSLATALLGRISTEQIGTGLILRGGQQLGEVLSRGLDAVYFQTLKETRRSFFGLVSSSSTREVTTGIGGELSRQLGLVLGGLADSAVAAVGALGGDVEAARQQLNALSLGQVRIDLQGLSAEDAQERLESVFGAIGDTIALALLPGVAEFQRAGEGAFETLNRVASETRIVQQRLDSLGFALGQLTGLDLARVGQQLIDLAGGAENFISNTGTFFGEFFSDEEQTESLRQQLVEAVDALGFALPAARAGFRELISSLDLTTEQGQRAFTQLTTLAGAADRYYDTLDEAMERYADAAKGLRDFRESMRSIAETANGVSLVAARQRFDSTGRLARLGNLDALQSLPDLGRALASASQAQSLTRTDVLRDLARIRLTASLAEDVATRLSLSDLAAQQLAEQKAQTALLSSINDAIVPMAAAGTGSGSDSAAELAALRQEMADLKQFLHAIAVNTGKTAQQTRWLEDWDVEGLPKERAA